MSFWRPGEAYPDQVEEERLQISGDMPIERIDEAKVKKRVELSDLTKNMPFMVRSNDEKQRKKEEVVALKELKSYMWSYRRVTPTDDMSISTHPCSGKAINPIEQEECQRYSFGGFNSKVDEIMKEREDYRSMKKGGAKVQRALGSDDIMETLNKYSAMKGISQQKRRGNKRSRD